MALILPVKGIFPKIANNCFLAPNATIVGDVEINEDSSIWFNAVIRGDVNSIIIGKNVNIQDSACIHCTYEKTKTIIGNSVSIGHNAIVHGCTIENNVLIGMGAIVMDNAYIETGSIIAAGAVVLENTIVKAGSIYAGVPAKFVKKVDIKTNTDTLERISKNYALYASWFKY